MDNLGVIISYLNMGISVMLLSKMFKNGVVDGLNAKRLAPYILFALAILVTSASSSSYFESSMYLRRELAASSEQVSLFAEALVNQISLCRKLGWQLIIQNIILTVVCLEILGGIKMKMELKSKSNIKLRWDFKEILNRM